MKELILSQPITQLYTHKITDTIRVMEQHFTTTGEIHYHLQSKTFGNWNNVHDVVEVVNVPETKTL